MNICRYITCNESLSLVHLVIWNLITVKPLLYGAFIIIDAPEWEIKLSYPSDRRKRRSHNIYVSGYFPHNPNHTMFTLYNISDPNMRVLQVKLI